MTAAPEEWRPVVDYEGRYEVSSHGRVRSLDRIITDRAGHSRRHTGRIMSTPLNGMGRPSLMLGGQNSQRVSNLVAAAFLGPRPPGQVVRHWDDDPTNNRVENLLYGTQSDNSRDCIRNGNHPWQRQITKTHGGCGHLLRLPNLRRSPWEKRGHRICLACGKAGSYVHRHPELRPKIRELADSYYREIMAEVEGVTIPADLI